MAQPPCPPAERWKAHLDGGLTADEQAMLTEHLDACTTCRKTLETLAAGGDSLLDAARQAGERTDASNAELQQVLAKFQTPPSETIAEPARERDDDLNFLADSYKPGSLGRLEHYEIQQVIGKGGFGIVLKAFDEKLHRVVAIKVLSPAYAANGAARARFIREARTAAAVKNEHVVAIHSVGDTAQPPFLVMEIIDGISLQDKIDKKGPLSLKEILRIGSQTAEGLAAAHKQGLVHRDIKPANILLENGVERVKITDFGLARTTDEMSNVTAVGVVAGTPMYMSPEQAEGLAIDHRSDLFSLGTVLYAMCTGHPPFRASGTHAVLKRVIEASPRAIRETNNEIPDWLCDIISKLHAKKPEDRYQSAKEVAELLGARLADVQAGRAIEGRAEVRKAPIEPLVEIARSRRTLGWRIALAAVLLLAFVFAAIAYFWPKNPDDETRGSVVQLGTIVLGGFYDPVGLEKVVLRRVRIVDQQIRHDGDRGVELKQEAAFIKNRKSSEAWVPPGQYQIEVVPKPGYKLAKYEIAPQLPGIHQSGGGDKSRPVIDVKHQDRITLQFIMEKDAPAADWVQLFNGKDLAGWNTDTPNAWKVQNNHIVGTNGYLRCAKSFGDFHARVELRMKGTGDIAFRGIANNWVGAPLDNTSAVGRTGSLVHELNGDWQVLVDHKNDKFSPHNWFTLEIITRGKKATIKIDGVITAEQTIERMLAHGYFDFKVERPDGQIEIRKIEIKELPPEGEPWVQLWNGKDFTGWDNKTKNQWSIDTVAGELICSGRAGTPLTYSAKTFRDFHLRCDVEYVKQTQIKVFFRAFPGGERHLQGYAAMINSIGNRGSIVLYSDKSKGMHNGAEYRKNETLPARHQFEVIARGPNITIKEDGEVVAEISDSTFREGLIAFAAAAGHGEARFHRIEIKELPPEEPGWTEFFKANDLNGWNAFTFEKGDAKAAWKVEGDVLVGTGKPSGYLHTTRPYENYELSFEWQAPKKLAGQNECLLYVHGQLPHERLPRAIGINLFEDTKVIHFVSGPDVFSKVSTIEPEFGTKPTGTWQKVHLVCKGDAIEVRIDGKTRLNGAGFPLRSGFIALRSAGQSLQVRNLTIRSLLATTPTDAEKDDWVQLFNGKDLTGWKKHPDQPGDWQVQDSLLVGKGREPSHLFSERGNFSRFHLRAVAKLNQAGNSGLFFRCEYGLSFEANGKFPSGYEAQMAHAYKQNLTGSLLRNGVLVRVQDKLVAPDEWYVHEVLADGKRIVVKVNGQTTADVPDDDPAFLSGHLALQLMRPETPGDTVVHFKKIEFKELPPEVPGWVQLFNGKDLTGWQINKTTKGSWIVDKGVLKGTGDKNVPHSLHATRPDQENYQLRMRAHLNPGGSATLGFRVRPDGAATGILLQLHHKNTGELQLAPTLPVYPYVNQAKSKCKLRPDHWFDLEVRVARSRIEALIDGEPVAKHNFSPADSTGVGVPGGLRLDAANGASTLSVRKIEIKERPTPAPAH